MVLLLIYRDIQSLGLLFSYCSHTDYLIAENGLVERGEMYMDLSLALLNCLFSIFHSFKGGIADANISFKWRKILFFLKNKRLKNVLICLSTTDYFIIHSYIFFISKFLWKIGYRVLAAQGLNPLLRVCPTRQWLNPLSPKVLLSFFHHICISYHTREVIFIMRRISLSAHISIFVLFSSTNYGSYVIMWSIVWQNTNVVHFCAIWDNTALVQWMRCLPKGSHLIHWTSAVIPISHTNGHRLYTPCLLISLSVTQWYHTEISI